MTSNFKDIHLGFLIKHKVQELEIETSRICNFIKCSEEDVETMFLQKDLSTDVLLKWSKLLEYDFFRLYTQHLILFSPPGRIPSNKRIVSNLPKFKKNIYTGEIIDFILELINSGEKTKKEIINDYRIPKTTLYKWISKYNNK